jgi:hypothetical protein
MSRCGAGVESIIPIGDSPPMISHAIIGTSHFLKDNHGFGVGVCIFCLPVVLEHALKLISCGHWRIFSEIGLVVIE